jgi:hypothetical protein
MLAVNADGIFWALVALAIVLVLAVIWRVIVNDRNIRRVRFGVFWERERDGDKEDA